MSGKKNYATAEGNAHDRIDRFKPAFVADPTAPATAPPVPPSQSVAVPLAVAVAQQEVHADAHERALSKNRKLSATVRIQAIAVQTQRFRCNQVFRGTATG